MKADLHIHSTESDGCLTIEEILFKASEKNIGVLAITDHETTLGVKKAQDLAPAYGISIIPGIELYTSYRQEEVHLLGYYQDIDNDYLQENLMQLRKERTEITRCMVEKLNQKGLAIEWEQVRDTASEEGVVCKTHIMYTVWNSYYELLEVNWNIVASWFRPGGIAYVPYEGNPYHKAVDFIYQTRGIPVLAHPGLIKNQAIIKDLLTYKPIGLEVYYGYWEHSQEKVRLYEELAKDKAILSTGGSDYHSFYSPYGIGEVFVPAKCAQDLRKYLQWK